MGIPRRKPGDSSLCAFVFLPGRKTATDMALLLVFIQNFPNTDIQGWIAFWKPL